MDNRHMEEEDELEYIDISRRQRSSESAAQRRAGRTRRDTDLSYSNVDVTLRRQSQRNSTPRAERTSQRVSVPRLADMPQDREDKRVVSAPLRDGTPQSAERQRRSSMPQDRGELHVVGGLGRDASQEGSRQRRSDSSQGGGARRTASVPRRDVRSRQGSPVYREQGRNSRSRRRRRRKKRSAVPVICLIFLVAVAAGVFFYINSLAYKRCRMQAGGKVTASDFIRKGDENAFFTQDSAPFDTHEPGEYRVKVKSGLFTHRCTLIVEDTVAPTAEAVQVRLGVGETCRPEDFVKNVEDATAVTVAFAAQPDFSKSGRQQVRITLTDKGNNTTTVDSELYISAVVEDVYVEMGGSIPDVNSFLIVSQPAEFVTDMNSLDYNKPGDYTVKLMVDGEEETSTLHIIDKVPPVITGAADLEIYTGDGVAYRKNVVVTDNWPEGLSLDVDSSQVNTDEAGVYPVTYIATDAAGNTSSVTVNLTVKARAYDMETVNELADAVLAQIITADMEPIDKVRAIYNYNMSHIGYIEHSDKGDWVKAAYEGLTQGRGDCYVYACTAKLLLTRAGINNMDIVKIPSDSEHYWNLVDIGEGWYHFDTTPRKDHPTIFMWTEEQMMAYSAAHKNSHNYDHDDYPEVN